MTIHLVSTINKFRLESDRMKNLLADYKKNKEYLVCIDSDGCAIDTMDIKHIKCFGPCMVKEWNLEEWATPILTSWNDVNLYTLTRGINRFKGLAVALEEINAKYTKIEGLDVYLKWTKEATELSNESLAVEYEKTNNICIKKALEWSKAVNLSIDELSDDDKMPFGGVGEALAAIHKYADIAIVSSANRKAVEDEWSKSGLLQYVDIVLTQDIGVKSYCIAQMMEKGYKKENVLMCGDAVGDLDAAKKNDVFFYPIMVKKEEFSWNRFTSEVLSTFVEGKYNEVEERFINEFKENLTK